LPAIPGPEVLCNPCFLSNAENIVAERERRKRYIAVSSLVRYEEPRKKGLLADEDVCLLLGECPVFHVLPQ
jgi:hypothetical protein